MSEITVIEPEITVSGYDLRVSQQQIAAIIPDADTRNEIIVSGYDLRVSQQQIAAIIPDNK